MARANACMKIFLVVVNLVVVLIGLGILGVGVYICVDAKLGQFSELLTGFKTLHSVRFVVIAAGVLIAVMGLCGCVGACKDNRCLLGLYLVFLVATLVLNVTVVVLSVQYNDKVKNTVGELIRDELKRKYGADAKDDNSEAFTKAIDNFQTNQSACCGWTGKDAKQNFFTSTPWYVKQGANPAKFPDSCCQPSVLQIPEKKDKCVRADNEQTARSDGYIFEDDCLDILINTNRRFMASVLGTVILAIVLQFLCFIAAIVVIRHVSSGNAGRVV